MKIKLCIKQDLAIQNIFIIIKNNIQSKLSYNSIEKE